MSQKYVPGKCNIGTRGRAVRTSTGLVIVGLSLGFGALALPSGLLRLPLAIPAYIAILLMLMGANSFCVMGASRGSYDLHEKFGLYSSNSPTRVIVENEEWRLKDHRKALLMQSESVVGAILLAILLVLV